MNKKRKITEDSEKETAKSTELQQLYGKSYYENIAKTLIWSGVIIIGITTVLYTTGGAIPFLKFHYGEYGEYVGGIVGSLWALAGVMLFYEAIKHQRAEVKMQRHELELQRFAISGQTDQSKKHNEMVKTQTFENTFFNLISLYNQIIDTMEFDISEIDKENKKEMKKVYKRECFVEYYNKYKKIFNYTFEKIQLDDFSQDSLQLLVEYTFRVFYDEYQIHLGHYFRTLLNLFKFINNNSHSNKKFYIDLIISQLSNYELSIIFFVGLSEKFQELKSLIEKFSLLREVPEDEFVQYTKELYRQEAFGIYVE